MKYIKKCLFSRAGVFCLLVFLDVILIVLFLALYRRAETPAQAAGKVLHTCQNKQRYLDCIGKEFEQVMAERGFPFLMQALLEYQKDDPQIQNCHVIAHKIIQAYTRKNPSAWKDILQTIDPGTCGGGFMHGVLEVRVGDDPDFNVSKELFHTICETIYTDRYVTSCAHILGHIIFVENLGNLSKSFRVCNGLTGELLFECFGGIFMEDSFRTNFFDHQLGDEPVRDTAWFKKQFARCQLQKEPVEKEAGCFYDLAEVAAQIKNFDVAKTYDVCMTAKSKLARDRCYIRASYVIATAPVAQIDSMDFSEMCNLDHPDDTTKKRCISDTVSALESYSLLFTPRAKKLCMGQQEPYQAFCFENLAENIQGRVVDKQERETYCAGLPELYHNMCMR